MAASLASTASTASPASGDQARKTRLPGWKAILVREETFERLHRIQASTVDPRLDLRYIGDAAVLIALDATPEKAVVTRAVAEMQRCL